MKKDLLIKLKKALLNLNDIQTDKGTLVYEGELEIGTEVMIEDMDGNWIEAPDGEYRSETEVIVVEAGKVSDIKKEEEPEPEPEPAPADEEPKDENLEDPEPEPAPAEDEKDARIAELEARIAELEAENAELKAKLDEAEVTLKASAAKSAKEEFKNENKPATTRRRFI